jgi:transcriptional regulator with XRE-family HTH domain
VDINDAVAEQLRRERGAQRISIAELARRSGIPEVSLGRYLNGKREINIAVLANVAHALGVEPAVVFTEAQRRLDGLSQADVTLAAYDDDELLPELEGHEEMP